MYELTGCALAHKLRLAGQFIQILFNLIFFYIIYWPKFLYFNRGQWIIKKIEIKWIWALVRYRWSGLWLTVSSYTNNNNKRYVSQRTSGIAHKRNNFFYLFLFVIGPDNVIVRFASWPNIKEMKKKEIVTASALSPAKGWANELAITLPLL